MLENLSFCLSFIVFPSTKKEHFADMRHLQFNKSALIEYIFDNEHFMDWTNAKILDFEFDFTKCRFMSHIALTKSPTL